MSGKKDKKNDFGQMMKMRQVATWDAKRKREQDEHAPVAAVVKPASVGKKRTTDAVPVLAISAAPVTTTAPVAVPVRAAVAPVPVPAPVNATSAPVAPCVVAPQQPPQIERVVNVAPAPSLPWTEKHRPVSIVRVIGNSKAKETVHQWFTARQWRQPLLIAGPNGVGKTSLAHAACRDFGFMVQDCNVLPGELLVTVRELLHRKGNEHVALVLDEVHTYTPSERSEIAKLLKRPLMLPVILICDEPDKSVDVLKSVCKVVRMYRQVGGVGDVTTLTTSVLRAESKGLYPSQLSLIHAASCGDLRRCTIMLELACKTRRCKSIDERGDLFVDSLFTAASSLLYQKPRFVTFEQGMLLFKQHDLLSYMIHENYADACDLESAVSVVTSLSDVDTLDAHPSHHCHEHATALVCASTMASSRAVVFGGVPQLTFPSFLATLSRRKSFHNMLHESRLSWHDWRLLSVNFSWLQQATSLTPKELSKVINSYALTVTPTDHGSV